MGMAESLSQNLWASNLGTAVRDRLDLRQFAAADKGPKSCEPAHGLTLPVSVTL